ncbi:MAG: hypothetical protein IVW57_19230, partial [Ktedonobacterales bacterium]|nr:hypothetical protein [Ktedonobacterales bacterium]
ALDIQARAQARLVRGYGYDTGFMKSSIYTVTSQGSSYGAKLHNQGNRELLPQAQRKTGLGVASALVAVGAAYGQDVEFGTSKMAAKPFLIPAAEAVRPVLAEALSRLVFALEAASYE